MSIQAGILVTIRLVIIVGLIMMVVFIHNDNKTENKLSPNVQKIYDDMIADLEE